MIKTRYEIGDQVLFHSTVGNGWIPATVVSRHEVLSVTGALLGYDYVVRRDGEGYNGDNACFEFELKPLEADPDSPLATVLRRKAEGRE